MALLGPKGYSVSAHSWGPLPANTDASAANAVANSLMTSAGLSLMKKPR